MIKKTQTATLKIQQKKVCSSHLSCWSEKFQANYENFTFKKPDMTDNVCCYSHAGTKECEEQKKYYRKLIIFIF
jgi:hypothetical protein